MTDCSIGASSAPTTLPGSMPHARFGQARIVEHVPLARSTWRLRLHCPEIAASSWPGQFYMLRIPGVSDPLLGRPFALFDTWHDESGHVAGIDIGYVEIGKFTRLLASGTVDALEIWGPLGNGFPVVPQRRVLMVAGGIGQTPFLAVAKELLGQRGYGRSLSPEAGCPDRRADEVTLLYGVRNKAYLGGLNDFAATGINLEVATDDGSRGHRGFVTELLDRQLQETTADTVVLACGPEPMLHAAARVAARHQVTCWLSLEAPMACGFGACFSCVVKVRQPDGGWDYARSCVEGPVFRADQLVLGEGSVA